MARGGAGALELGREAILRLVDRSDVFVSNVRPAALARLGLDDASLRARVAAAWDFWPWAGTRTGLETAANLLVSTAPGSTTASDVLQMRVTDSGVPVRLLPIDKVEPETPTVKDGRYPLRRPVLLLSNNEPDPLIEAFEQFALSDEGQKILSESYTPLPKTSSP